ncbi:exosome complex exonuclease RRP41 [Catenaria anguillulae PL171]|uniref:Ribosomal RNA-processing protein 41 n=1 Tax=Catenaria anguillulae PL171 TaxID=765915 RepID=A0A1Y2HVZ6_9FUNG|nr:exosome complex exonuclease RRP41 [Catenaria anguillulae PL171]
MGRQELINPEGLRLDGRRAHELRRISAKPAVLAQADGSAYIEIGNTKVLAAVYGPRECRIRSHALHDRAVINVEYTQASFSRTIRRKQRKLDRKNMELAMQLRETFSAVVTTEQYPRSQIDIYLTLMQSDGGEVMACINAATLALINAGVAMRDYVVACSVGIYDGTPLLDVNHFEEGPSIPTLTLATLPRTGDVVLMQCEQRLHMDRLQAAMALAQEGCAQMHTKLDEVVRKELTELAIKVGEREASAASMGTSL